MSGEMGGGFAGRKAGVKSNFSVTCSLLSQYLKEKGSVGDLALGFARSFDAKGNIKPETSRTMNLLPGMNSNTEQPPEVSNPTPLPDLNATKRPDPPVLSRPVLFGRGPPVQDAQKKPEPRAPQMTIFYGGKVLVFDNFPAEKAKELVTMASKGSATPLAPQNLVSFPDRSTCPPPQNAAPASTSGEKPVSVATTTSTVATAASQDCPRRPVHLPIASDLPIARRVSLNRFLEKRKGRINSKAPYQVEGSPDLASSSGATSGSSNAEEAAAFPGFGQPEVMYGKQEKAAATLPAYGKPDQTANLLAFGKREEPAGTPASREPEEKQTWLGLATPSSSSMLEFEPKGQR